VGSTQIRNKAQTRKSESNKLLEPQIAPSNSSRADRPDRTYQVSGAMAQQNCDSGWGKQSAPQKLLHLVGCREQKDAPKRPVSTQHKSTIQDQSFALNE
jgi:hypothetical protein